MEPIYEVHKVDRCELTELPCRATHQILARSSKVSENDNVYAIFVKYIKHDITFLQNWLKVFMMANKKNFEIRARKYLASKVLTYENWSDSISDGRKGDVLVLYGLCMLLGKHVIVHLHSHFIWSTLAELGNSHAADLEKCEIHLCYLGRGLFMELSKCEHPLEIIRESPQVQLIVVGELTVSEEQTYQKIAHTGLGFGVWETSQRLESIVCKPSTSTDVRNKSLGIATTSKKIIKVMVRNLGIIDTERLFTVTEQFLSQLPVSKYRPISYLKEITSTSTDRPEDTSADSDATIAYSSSDETILYSIGDNYETKTKPKSCTFSVNLHGIKRRQKYYCFKCVVSNCNKSFKCIRDWNTHHRIHHKFKLKCTTCGCKFAMPSAH